MNGHAMDYCPQQLSKLLLLHGQDKAAKNIHTKNICGEHTC